MESKKNPIQDIRNHLGILRATLHTHTKIRSQATLLRKPVIERKTTCEMLYHNLLDCDPQTNSLRYKQVLLDERIIPTGRMARAVPQSVRL